MSLLDIAMTVVDSIMAVIPRQVPERAALERCKIISHRGEHDNRTVMENTLQAFERAISAGVWGIECDIRWTADLVPVICHDDNPGRVFGVTTAVRKMTFEQLRAQVPDIPTLQDVIHQFAGKTHLMLEIKAEPWPDIDRQCRSRITTCCRWTRLCSNRWTSCPVSVSFRLRRPMSALSASTLSRAATAASAGTTCC